MSKTEALQRAYALATTDGKMALNRLQIFTLPQGKVESPPDTTKATPHPNRDNAQSLPNPHHWYIIQACFVFYEVYHARFDARPPSQDQVNRVYSHSRLILEYCCTACGLSTTEEHDVGGLYNNLVTWVCLHTIDH